MATDMDTTTPAHSREGRSARNSRRAGLQALTAAFEQEIDARERMVRETEDDEKCNAIVAESGKRLQEIRDRISAEKVATTRDVEAMLDHVLTFLDDESGCVLDAPEREHAYKCLKSAFGRMADFNREDAQRPLPTYFVDSLDLVRARLDGLGMALEALDRGREAEALSALCDSVRDEVLDLQERASGAAAS